MKILVLNSDMQPLNITTLQRGFNLVFTGKAEIVKYDDDKPIQNREVLNTDKEKELEISEFLKEKEEIVNIIKLISGSLNVNLLDEDIYDILILYELLDHTILSDTRYEMRDISFTDIRTDSNIHTYTTQKDLLTFGLTKRLNFNGLFN